MVGYFCVYFSGKSASFTEQPKVLLIDIGGFTVDYLLVRYGVSRQTDKN